MLLGLLNRIPFLGYVALLGWVAAASAGWLYKEQVELTARVQSGCEAAMYKGALETAVASMRKQAEIHQNWRIRMQEQVAAQELATARAEAIAGAAMERLHAAQRALEEADNACLNDRVPADLIVSLQQ